MRQNGAHLGFCCFAFDWRSMGPWLTFPTVCRPTPHDYWLTHLISYFFAQNPNQELNCCYLVAAIESAIELAAAEVAYLIPSTDPCCPASGRMVQTDPSVRRRLAASAGSFAAESFVAAASDLAASAFA